MKPQRMTSVLVGLLILLGYAGAETTALQQARQALQVKYQLSESILMEYEWSELPTSGADMAWQAFLTPIEGNTRPSYHITVWDTGAVAAEIVHVPANTLPEFYELLRNRFGNQFSSWNYQEKAALHGMMPELRAYFDDYTADSMGFGSAEQADYRLPSANDLTAEDAYRIACETAKEAFFLPQEQVGALTPWCSFYASDGGDLLWSVHLRDGVSSRFYAHIASPSGKVLDAMDFDGMTYKAAHLDEAGASARQALGNRYGFSQEQAKRRLLIVKSDYIVYDPQETAPGIPTPFWRYTMVLDDFEHGEQTTLWLAPENYEILRMEPMGDEYRRDHDE